MSGVLDQILENSDCSINFWTKGFTSRITTADSKERKPRLDNWHCISRFWIVEFTHIAAHILP
jgi:hypothetical protein